MTKPKAKTISGPFDARHVGGVSIPGATNPVAGLQRSSTASGLEPDETPSHTYVASGNTEVPRRSNTIASTLSRPSLRLKTSISVLRGRSGSKSPDTYRKKERDATPEPKGYSPQKEMPVQSLRKKPSTSRLWGRIRHDTEPKITKTATPRQKDATPPPPPPPPPEAPVETSMASLTRKTSIVRMTPRSVTDSPEHYKSPYSFNPASAAIPREPSKRQLPAVRSKRADSGTAIDFDDVPVQDRPLGFKEIVSVSSFEQRMALYKKTREYWANADHGLNEWMGGNGVRRPFVPYI